MHKDDILQELLNMLATGEITRQEVVSALDSRGIDGRGVEEVGHKKKHRHLSPTKILYGIGALIVILGIVFFVAQIWWNIGVLGRVAVTLGLGIMFAISGSLLIHTRPDNQIGKVFHAIGGLLMPGGAVVLLLELFDYDMSLWKLAAAFSVLFVFYLVLGFAQKKEVLTFFTIANGTSALYFIVLAMLEGSFTAYSEEIITYLTMMVGFVYMLLAHGFRNTWNRQLSGVLYFFGSAGFYIAAFTQVFDSKLWEVCFFVLALVGVVLSVKLRSKAVLVVSTLALVGHIIYITSEYFADSLGWPISLVILGFVIIGLGYGSVTLSKKFIAKKKSS